MDSLFANYASSSDEEEEKSIEIETTHKSDDATIISSTTNPKSSFTKSFFSSLPPPKSNQIQNPKSKISQEDPEFVSNSKPRSGLFESEFVSKKDHPSSSLLFSALPKAKLVLEAKNVVHFRINPDLLKSSNNEDSDDEEEERRNRREVENAKISEGGGSFTSRMGMPAPKNSAVLGALPSSAGTGRRSILESDDPVSTSSAVKTDIKADANYKVGAAHSFNPTLPNAYDSVNHGDYTVDSGAETFNPSYATYAGHENVGGDPTSYGPAIEDYANYGGYETSGQYENKWIDRSAAGQQVYEAAVESVVKVPGKRGRNEIPREVIEVKQDELMKNRPREDQAKVTGIAFGPSYQPVSTKGKPSKLHKRKHQIGSLYFDMRQKETELAERRSKGFLTKAETHAKYGW